MQETIIILDFGSQYTQLIARRVRELNVYCEIHPFYHLSSLTLQPANIKGVILSGSPYSVRDENAPRIDFPAVKGNIPVLGICYGAQLIAHQYGGEVAPSQIREYGRAGLTIADTDTLLLKGMSKNSQVWMSHGDTIVKIPDNCKIIASTSDVAVAAYHICGEKTYGIQFHPEVFHSTEGSILLKNFVVDICGCYQNWTPDSFVGTTVNTLKEKLGNDKVVLGLSGGVDSTVAAVLLHRAIGKNLYCIFVDNGLLRKNEFDNVLHSYKNMGLNVKGVDAKQRFYTELEGVTDPEKKRKIIGKTFIDVFEKEIDLIKRNFLQTEIHSRKTGTVIPELSPKTQGKECTTYDTQSSLVETSQAPSGFWLAQGTIYPDVIESVSVKGPSATIKSHHNVGGLPEKMNLKIVEPLNTLFKDEVRKVGEKLGIDKNILHRHPFPGPGLAVRILGEITKEKINILQEADNIFIENLKTSGLYDSVWQAGVVLLPVKSVGVMGDERTYQNTVALRAVTSTDGMTADWCHLPYTFLAKVSNEIINKVKGVNRVVYDISSKPPATIEWE